MSSVLLVQSWGVYLEASPIMPVAGSPFVRTRELTDLIALSSVPSRDDESMSNIITICYVNETKEKDRRT